MSRAAAGQNHRWGSRSRSRIVAVLLFLTCSAGLLALFTQGTFAELNGPGAGERRVTKSVAILLQRYHMARRPLDDELAGRALDNFLKGLDPGKIYFLQADIDEFAKQRTQIDDQIIDGDIKLAFDIYGRFTQRVDEADAMIDELLEMKHDFTVDEERVIDRDSLTFPKDENELRERWRMRIKHDLLALKASQKKAAEAGEAKPEKEAFEKLRRRYHSFAKRMKQMDNDELLEMYLTAMTMGYDPHTNFMSATTVDNFEIDMKKELDGIGASLQTDDGFTLVHKIIPGGAADKDGRLKIKDQIVAVGQGDEGEMVDVVDMKLSDVVKLIRGKRGTKVRLTVVSDGDKQQKTYDITRDRIELTDSVARAEIVEYGKKADGSPYKIGWINLPSFYMDMTGARLGRQDFRSTTRDCAKILEDFKAKGVDAVVMDLKQNGGGSLREAVNLTGLFIEKGPVVQVKGFEGDVEELEDTDPEMAWTGPLVVLTSKFSASASEIFAGAIQDYKRGLVVGDKTTHGKGTVQQLLDLGQQIFRVPNSPKLGALKITIQQFYRPCGDSTQNRGVISDIELPSLTTHLDVGESDLDFALAFDKVDAVEYKSYNLVDANLLTALKSKSQERCKECAEFQKENKKIQRYLAQKNRKTVVLNEEKFMAEIAELDGGEEKEVEELTDPNRPVVKKDHYFDEEMSITIDYLSELKKLKLAGK